MGHAIGFLYTNSKLFFTEEELVVFQAESCDVFVSYEVGCGESYYVEAGSNEAVSKVGSVASDVVVLAEEAPAVGGVCNGGVLDCFFDPNGDHEDGPAGGFEDAVQVAECFSVIGYVLEDMAAINDVE